MPGAVPFYGIKVADFSLVGVGPATTKYLSNHGATVVRVETGNPLDIQWVAGPFKNNVLGTVLLPCGERHFPPGFCL